jgi:putative tryptophan/tyrosine transport system substrate-binding protein
VTLKRRDFITLLGGMAATGPLAARAQQPAMPVIGSLSGSSAADPSATGVDAFRTGLRDAGLIAGENVTILYRYAEARYERLPALAAELVSYPVALIFVADTASALAAKAATGTIPIVFALGSDPVKVGLVASLNRPGGNITGMTFLANTLPAKVFDLLHETLPSATSVAFLVNPTNPNTDSDLADVRVAADKLGRKLVVLRASTDDEIKAAAADASKRSVGAFYADIDPFLASRREEIVALMLRNAIPTIGPRREWTEAGALMSYGTRIADAQHQAGLYAGRILKGESPAALPVMLPTKFEFVINLKTAKSLGVTVPPTLLVVADEVIE